MTPADLERMALGRGGKITRVKLTNSPPPEDCSEEDFLQAVLGLFRRNGWTTYHTRDSRRSDKDFPDLVLGRGPGYAVRLVVAELKVGKNKPTPGQYAWLGYFQASGIPAFFWRPADWPAIVAVAEAGT